MYYVRAQFSQVKSMFLKLTCRFKYSIWFGFFLSCHLRVFLPTEKGKHKKGKISKYPFRIPKINHVVCFSDLSSRRSSTVETRDCVNFQLRIYRNASSPAVSKIRWTDWRTWGWEPVLFRVLCGKVPSGGLLWKALWYLTLIFPFISFPVLF